MKCIIQTRSYTHSFRNTGGSLQYNKPTWTILFQGYYCNLAPVVTAVEAYFLIYDFSTTKGCLIFIKSMSHKSLIKFFIVIKERFSFFCPFVFWRFPIHRNAFFIQEAKNPENLAFKQKNLIFLHRNHIEHIQKNPHVLSEANIVAGKCL